MDNTKANRTAMEELEEQISTALAIGCQAHAQSLLCKDFAIDKKCPMVTKTLDIANMMSNTINDSECIRSIVLGMQKQEYNKTKALESHVPTRFATKLFVLKSVLPSKEAIKQSVISDKWAKAAKNSTHKAYFSHSAIAHNNTFWKDVVSVVD